jgi:hypothetical protein
MSNYRAVLVSKTLLESGRVEIMWRDVDYVMESAPDGAVHTSRYTWTKEVDADDAYVTMSLGTERVVRDLTD